MGGARAATEATSRSVRGPCSSSRAGVQSGAARSFRLTLTVCVGVALVQPLTARAQPKVEISPQVIDVGVVAQGEVINASVLVANRGNATLKVWNVLPTVAGPLTHIQLELAPGQEQVLALPRLDTSGFVGPITKAILLFTNDPKREQVNIVVKALVWVFVEVLPHRFLRFDILEGQEQSAAVVLASKDRFEILSAIAGDPRVSTSFEPTRREGFASAYALTVRLKGTEPWGIVGPDLVVRTTHPFAPAIRLPVVGVIRPIIQPMPAEVNFGATKAEQVRNVLLIYNDRRTDFAVRDPRVDDSAFRLELLTLQPGKRFQLVISVAVDAKPGHHQATVTLTTSDPEHPRLTIPVTADIER